jgi:hypothetical protein
LARAERWACAQLSPGAVEALEHDESEACAETARDLDLRPSRVTRTQVFAAEAKVDLSQRVPGAHLQQLAAVCRGLRAATSRPAVSVRGRSLMRAMFVLYLVVIAAGLVYFTALGLWSL